MVDLRFVVTRDEQSRQGADLLHGEESQDIFMPVGKLEEHPVAAA